MVRAWILLGLITIAGLVGSPASASAPRTIPVVALPGSMDGEDTDHPAMYFDYAGADFQIDASDPTRPDRFDRVTLLRPGRGMTATDPGDPSVRVRGDESIDAHAIHASADGSLLMVRAEGPTRSRWLFIDVPSGSLVGELPDGVVEIEGGTLTWASAPPALEERLRAIAARDPWLARIWPRHRAAIEDPRAIARAWLDHASDPTFDPSARALAGRLIDAAPRAIEPARLAGRWRVRSIQASDLGIFVYPYFDAVIEPQGDGLRFRKTTGSQRRSGWLFARGDRGDEYVFLGGRTMNDAPPVGYSADEPDAAGPRETDTVGVLYPLSPDQAVLLLDADREGGFELYELRRPGSP